MTVGRLLTVFTFGLAYLTVVLLYLGRGRGRGWDRTSRATGSVLPLIFAMCLVAVVVEVGASQYMALCDAWPRSAGGKPSDVSRQEAEYYAIQATTTVGFGSMLTVPERCERALGADDGGFLAHNDGLWDVRHRYWELSSWFMLLGAACFMVFVGSGIETVRTLLQRPWASGSPINAESRRS